MKETFNTLFSKPVAENGFNKPAAELNKRYTTALPDRSDAVCVPISGGGTMDNAKYKTEMAMTDEHPTASCAVNLPPKCSRPWRSATAMYSSPRSPVAPTPPTPVYCWQLAYWRRRP